MVPFLPELPCSSLGTHVEHLCPVGTELLVLPQLQFVTVVSLLP